jgi:short-subunit dehydrogenase
MQVSKSEHIVTVLSALTRLYIGITSVTNFLEEEFDDDGEMLPPNNRALEVNLLGLINTVKMGVYCLKGNVNGGSVVITASGGSFQRFTATDYTISKHGALGLMRALTPLLYPQLRVRINAIGPGWTATGIVPPLVQTILESQGIVVQQPEKVARAAALLMADDFRHGQLIYTECGVHKEVEEVMMKTVSNFLTQSTEEKSSGGNAVGQT